MVLSMVCGLLEEGFSFDFDVRVLSYQFELCLVNDGP